MGNQGESSCCRKENAHKFGRYKRSSDGQMVQRYYCKNCRKTFSQATHEPTCWQKKRHLNHKCLMLLASCVSMRRTGLILGLNPKTVARKVEFLGAQSREKLAKQLQTFTTINTIQFDELQTTEHTKCKPLSVAMAVSDDGRKILAYRVSSMPATGHLAAISRKKYGPRRDDRKQGLQTLFQQLQPHLNGNIKIVSDECSYYAPIIRRYFPRAEYHQFKGEKSSVSGQGELKKVRHDPLFSINHTFAMLRANINRLVRKTWCTTKKVSRLIDHLSIYAWVHNSKLTPQNSVC